MSVMKKGGNKPAAQCARSYDLMNSNVHIFVEVKHDETLNREWRHPIDLNEFVEWYNKIEGWKLTVEDVRKYVQAQKESGEKK